MFAFQVGSTAKVTFTFTANKETENIIFHYQVQGRKMNGDLVLLSFILCTCVQKLS